MVSAKTRFNRAPSFDLCGFNAKYINTKSNMNPACTLLCIVTRIPSWYFFKKWIFEFKYNHFNQTSKTLLFVLKVCRCLLLTTTFHCLVCDVMWVLKQKIYWQPCIYIFSLLVPIIIFYLFDLFLFLYLEK